MRRFATPCALAAAMVCLTAPVAGANCTQGFWENHPEHWCTDDLYLGNVYYTADQLLDIFDQEVQGNGLVSLAHQLIAAKLNAACGSVPSPAAALADALIADLVVPPIGNGYLHPSQTSALVSQLDAYNNEPGDPNGFGGCSPIAVEEFSWGRVKASYR
ncbi:MAG: hypothetical protein ACRDGR_03040 [bacterium]